jgi:putative SOS response-associated peptidase YedK
MCNLFDNRTSFSALIDAFAQVLLPVVKPGPSTSPNLPPLDAIRPTDPAPVLRAAVGGVELIQMRWGLARDRPKAGPIINYRSEGRRFDAGRCLIPATGFCEFTGRASRKTRWRFTMTGEPWFCFAGVWRRQEPASGPGERFALLTVDAGPDMAPYHDRQPVVLGRGAWRAWLGGDGGVLIPSPAGVLQVARDLADGDPPPLFDALP